MKIITAILIGICLVSLHSYAQIEQGHVTYIIDSIPLTEDFQRGNDLSEADIDEVKVIKNKDSLKLLGYGKSECVIFVITKEFRNRPAALKQIPSVRQMEQRSWIWYFQGRPYTGAVIDYYYSGRKEGEGTFKDGKVDGLRKMYFQNGKIQVERNYSEGIENGLEKEYYEDGTLKQKGEFTNGKEEGVWEMFFPNGQVKQRSNYVNGRIEGETTVYYSSGKVLAVEITKNGKTTPDKRLEKINQAMKKGHESSKESDYKTAIKQYSKAIDLDSIYASAYFSRGTVRLNDFQFDEAILDFTKCLQIEPYYEKALSNRAFARIRKHQFGNSRQLSQSNGVTISASKDDPGIPESDLAQICADLQQAIFLGDRGEMIMEAVVEYCEKKINK